MAPLSDERLLTAEEFLQIDFGSDIRAELDRGVIRMRAGGTQAHARVQMNLYAFLRNALRGSGCRPYGSDMAVRTQDMSVRYPDLTIDCAPPAEDADQRRALADPRVIIEVLSPATRAADTGIKPSEYLALPGLATIALIDPENMRIRVLERPGDDWIDRIATREEGLAIPTLGVTVPHSEVFAED